MYRLSVYFNSAGNNFYDKNNTENPKKNFSSIYMNNENDKNLINYLNLEDNLTEDKALSSLSLSNKSFNSINSTLTTVKKSKSTNLKNILPPVYEQFFELSSKIFNITSLV